MKVISIGMFTPGNDPVVWRGPMLHRALQQFLADVYWGDLDVLLLDLPPGTGDIAISAGAARAERRDARRDDAAAAAAEVAERAGAIAAADPPAGGRAWSRTCRGWSCPTARAWRCSAPAAAQAVADSLTRTLGAHVPLLGQIPLDTRLRECGDAGAPIVLAEPDTPAAVVLRRIADRLAVRARGLAGRSLNITPA